MATFSTNLEIKAMQTGMLNKTDAILDATRKAVYALILSALYEGGYGVAAIVAAPTAWGFLTLLEIRLVTLDLLGGGAASPVGLAGGENWAHWETQINGWMSKLAAGQIALVNDTTGAITAAPHALNNVGILGETRNPGINLDAPELWDAADNLEVN